MINKPIDQITEADLNDLVSAAVAEQKTLDYKRDLPGNNDAAKRELLADVSSFANTAGGDLVFGMTESGGVATGIPGVQIGDIEQEIIRLGNIIRDGLSPRIRHTPHPVLLANGCYVLIIRSEQSWYGPHRVIFKNDSRFYGRTTNGKYELDVTDLRNAFLFSNTVAEKVSAFRSERILALANGQTLAPMVGGPKLVIHCMPLESFGNMPNHDVLSLDQIDIKLLGEERLRRGSRIINFEGVIAVASGIDYSAYTQIFRNGVIEAVCVGVLTSQDPNLIPGLLYEETVVKYLPECLQIIRRLGCSPPIRVGISLVGVRGLKLATPRYGYIMANTPAIDRDILTLPEIVVEDLSARAVPLLKPTLDMVWNACGEAASPYFDAGGNWIGRSN